MRLSQSNLEPSYVGRRPISQFVFDKNQDVSQKSNGPDLKQNKGFYL